MMVEITATLRNARFSQAGDRRILVGDVYDDRLQRWRDGERIHTTFIVDQVQKGIFLTRAGNYYRVHFDEG